MIRKQVYLTESIDQQIQVMAARLKQPEAQVIRDLLEKAIKQTHEERKITAGDALLNLAKLGKELGIHGEPDMSARIDDYLYGNDS